jgi:hypothetical protein
MKVSSEMQLNCNNDSARTLISVHPEIDPQPLGNGKHPLALGHIFEHLAHKPFTEGHHPFLMARRAKVAPLARRRQQVLMPSLITAHPSETAM